MAAYLRSSAFARGGFVHAWVLMILGLVGCSPHTVRLPIPRPYEQPFDRRVIASFDSIHWSRASIDRQPSTTHGRGPVPIKPPRVLPPPSNKANVHPLIRDWLAHPGRAPRKVELILTFKDSVLAPRLPGPVADTLIGSAAALARHHVVDSLVSVTRQARAPRYAADSTFLRARGVATLATSWLTQTMLVGCPFSPQIVAALVDTLHVLYVQPRYAGELPPGRSSYEGDDPAIARCAIDSDPYVPFCAQYGRIALLDTGVRMDHENLAGVLANTYTCAGRDDDCLAATLSDPCYGHGTSSAALLAGNEPTATALSPRDCEASPNGRYEGVTDAQLDVYQVYGSDCSTGAAQLDTWAAKLAIDQAVLDCAILIAEVDGVVTGPGESPEYTADDCNTMSNSADAAYSTGGLVIAAAGDHSVVGAPAVARRAIAAGAYSILTDNDYDGANGPTGDKRYKPDVVGPTNADAADNGAIDQYNVFGATSGATPFVGGAAALLRNWLIWASGGTASDVDPGQVCAQIILSGQSPSTPISGTVRDQFVADQGAGRIVLPTNGYGGFDKTSLDKTGADAWASFPIYTGIRKLEAALWWPEVPVTSYEADEVPSTDNDIDLEIYDPDGNLVKHSSSETGVFERATVDAGSGATLATGTWKLRIVGTRIGLGPQTVYWTAAARFP